MSDCDEIRPLLAAYLDGELRDPDRQAVARHLAACEQCSGELRELAESAALLAQLADAEPPATLATGFRRRVRRRASALIVFVVLALLAILPVGAIGQLVLQYDLPFWAKAGFALSALCFGAALLLLVIHLARQLRHLMIYAYLSGGER